MDTMRGNSFPFGAEVQDGGVNFSVFSKNADAVELLLFQGAGDPAPAHAISLDPSSKTDRQHYVNYTGCGSMLFAGSPIVRRVIIEWLILRVLQGGSQGFVTCQEAACSRIYGAG